MNKFWIFLSGAFLGIVLTVVAMWVVYNVKSNSAISGLTVFDERGQMMDAEQYSIMQTLDDRHALALELSFDNLVNNIAEDFGLSISSMMTPVLLIGDSDAHFYDGLELSATGDKCFYQVGTYRYQTKTEDWKTIPAVMLLDRR